MKKMLTSVATGVAIAVIPVSQAFACHYQLSGKGDCQRDGSYVITWNVDNRGNNEAFDIDGANVPGLVNTEVHANEIYQYHQVITGSHVNTIVHLHLNGHLKNHGNGRGHEHDEDNDAYVRIDKVCAQPQPPVQTPQQPTPQPGKGGGTVNGGTTVTPSTPAPTPAAQPAAQTTAQITVPKGAVNAGTGTKVTRFNPAAAFGLTGSLAAFGFGLRRLVKISR